MRNLQKTYYMRMKVLREEKEKERKKSLKKLGNLEEKLRKKRKKRRRKRRRSMIWMMTISLIKMLMRSELMITQWNITTGRLIIIE